MTVRRMRIACWISKATNTHSEYVTLIVFPLLLWLDNMPQCYVVRTLPVFLFIVNSNSGIENSGENEVYMVIPVVMLQKERHRNEHEN
jgi:hypothetical protein